MDNTLGKYQLVAELAHGGMGTVYLAVARGPARFSKLVVIKQLRPVFAADPTFTAMFLEEARLAACLHHPNIVQTNEIVCDPRHGDYIVMEYVEGASLKAVVRQLRARGSPSVFPLYARAILDVLSALEYAHDLKDFEGRPLDLVHRDVNPDNVVIAFGGYTKLLDFGIAKAADSTQHTQAGVLKGKLRYMAPEQMAGDPVDRRTDVFAVGGMLWDALAGRRLWDGVKGVDVMTSLVHGSIASPRSVNPSVPEALERVCMRALAFRAEDRYPDAPAMRADLERALGRDVMSVAEVATTLSTQLADEHRRTRALVAEQLWAIEQSQARALPSLASDPPPGQRAGSLTAEIAARTPSGLATHASSFEEDPFGRGRRRRLFALGAISAALALAVAATAAISVNPVRSTAGQAQGMARAATEPASSASALAATLAPADRRAGASAVATLPGGPAAPVPPSEGALAALDPRARLGLAPSSRSPRHAGKAPRSGAIAPAQAHAAASPSTATDVASTDAPDEAAPSDPPPSPSSEAEPSAPPPAPPSASSPPVVAASAPPAVAAVAPPAVTASAQPDATVAPGTISQSALRATVRSHSDEIGRCFDRDPVSKTARITMTATIATDGHASSVATSSDRDGTSRLQACIRDCVQQWTFPLPAGGAPGHVSYAFDFRIVEMPPPF